MSALPPEAAYWDARYAVDGRLWGDGPSELARLAVARLRLHASPELAVLEDKTNTEGHLDALLTLTHASMKRNYPEITAEEVEELVDRGNQTAVMFAVIAGQKVPANLGELLPAMLASLSQR